MTEKSKQIFADKVKLREKLGIYLQTPEKVEIYAQAAEKMFAKTGGSSIGFTATWSWWAFFGGGFFFLYRKIYLLAVICLVLSPILAVIISVVAALLAKYAVIKDFEKKLDLDSDMTLATGVNKWAIYALIALVVVVILAEIVGVGGATGKLGGVDESKAPKIMREFNSNPFSGAYHSFYAVSQDDDTIIKGATISGRNGKCKTQTAVMLMRHIRDDSLVRLFDSMSSCQAEQLDFWDCKPLFDGEKLAYNHQKIIYKTTYEECPPKNGVWYVKLDTNFGTFEYESSNR